MKVVIVATIVFAILAQNAVSQFSIPKWLVTLGLFGIGVGLFLVSSNLHSYFIENRAPEFVDQENGKIDTRGTAFVPRWVSHITSISFAAVLSATVPWIIGFLRWLF